MTTDEHVAAEIARSNAWHAELATLAKRLPLTGREARVLAFRIVTEFLAQLVGAPLGAVYTAKLHAVSALAIEMGRAVDSSSELDPEAWQYIALCKRADLLHGFFNIFSGPRGAWPDEHWLPSEAAEAVRLACERDVFAKLPLLYTLARAALVRTKMHPERLDELIEGARREAIAGLDALVQEAAAEPKADIVLQALHVACGAAAVESLRGPIVGVIDGVPVPVRGST